MLFKSDCLLYGKKRTLCAHPVQYCTCLHLMKPKLTFYLKIHIVTNYKILRKRDHLYFHLQCAGRQTTDDKVSSAELTQEVWGRGSGSLLTLIWILQLRRRSVELLGRLKVDGRRRVLVEAVSSTSARRSVSSPSLISSSSSMEPPIQRCISQKEKTNVLW